MKIGGERGSSFTGTKVTSAGEKTRNGKRQYLQAT